MSYARGDSRVTQKEDSERDLPPIAALFVVKFDPREGYKLIWSRSATDVELDGIVDFKSLPSGLHNIKEDLVYFVQDGYSGISAYVNVPGDASERHAQMLAVGALVPINQGRLGKSWRHAQGLHDLARKHLSNSERLKMLEDYWDQNRLKDDDVDGASPNDSPQIKPMPSSTTQVNGYRRRRGISDATALKSEQKLPSHHPALSLPKFVTDFGPLLFPLYRAALLRKRILIVGGPPVEQNCNFVYDLSILSSVPSSLLSLLPVDGVPPLRLRPLFNVGITDIPILELPHHSSTNSIDTPTDFTPSWVACTTDDVLAVKPQLYDILVKLPPSSYSLPLNYPKGPGQPTPLKPTWPSIYHSSPSLAQSSLKHPLKATQRDLRRHQALRTSLGHLPSAGPETTEPHDETETDNRDEDASVLSSSSSGSFNNEREIVESTPWPLIAFNGFMWWASAGERKDGLTEDEEAELEQDRALLDQDSGPEGAFMSPEDERGRNREAAVLEDEEVPKEMAIVGYFHRLTALIFTAVSDAISRVDGENVRRGSNAEVEDAPISPEERGRDAAGLGITSQQETSAADLADPDADEDEDLADENAPLLASSQQDEEGDDLEANGSIHEQPDVHITIEDMKQIGLDVWSRADREFVEEFVQLWWGRKATVEGGRIECCGVRVL